MNLRMRTLGEMQAYVEGYNACNKQFREYLKKKKTVSDAIIQQMDISVAAVNGVMGRETANNGAAEHI